MKHASAYSKDPEILRHRSGITVQCDDCKSPPDAWCKSKTGKPLLYNHVGRRKAGKAAADTVVLARSHAK